MVPSYTYEVSKIEFFFKHGVELVIGFLFEWTPKVLDVVGDVKDLIEVVVH